MKVPFLDLRVGIDAQHTELMAAVDGVLKGCEFILGPNVKAFEKEMAKYLGVKHCIGVNSGTDALVIGLRASGIGPGDEVITTAFTFFATAEAISVLGATPVFADIDPKTMNIDPKLVEKKITKKTKAILPVHIFGNPVDMDAIRALGKKHKLLIIEDNAQAMGADWKGRKLGTLGEVGAFSFFPSKNLGGFGDGGLICTEDDAVLAACQSLRAHGAKKKYYNEELGYNSRLDEMQAALLRVRMKALDPMNQGRRKAAAYYRKRLGDLGIEVQADSGSGTHVYHQFTIRIPDGKRDEVKQKLETQGISTMVYYPYPLHKLPVYVKRGDVLPHTERASAEALSLPIWSGISSAAQDAVLTALAEAVGGAKTTQKASAKVAPKAKAKKAA